MALVFGVFVFFEIVTQRTTTTSVTNTEYANALTSATLDAAKTIKTENYRSNKGCWRTTDDIDMTLSVFYKNLSRNFAINPEIGENAMKDKVPIVMLIDVDGFYLSYNAVFDEYGNTVVPASYSELNTVSDIYTWTENLGASSIRYYLTDYIDVVAANNITYSGQREEVIKLLTNDGVFTSELSFLNNASKFEEYKSVAIAKRCEETFNYYINTQMINVNRYLTGYDITFPAAAGEDWARSLTNPTVVAFLQGKQTSANGNFLNEFAFAAGEISAATMFFIEGNYYYRLNGPSVVETTVTTTIYGTGETKEVTVYTHNGVPITNFFTSMEQCAELGALPAPGEY